MLKRWSDTITIGCLVIAALVMAAEQALKDAPGASTLVPGSISGHLWQYAPLVLLTMAGIAWLFGSRKGVKQIDGQSAKTQVIEGALTKTRGNKLDGDAFIRQCYQGDLQSELEGNTRRMIEERSEPERTDFLCKFIAAGIISYVYDHVWWSIYRSQVLCLMELNRTTLRREQVKAFYDSAAQQGPHLYAAYSFDQWLSYLKLQILVLDLPGDCIGITERGKDFLKYMVHFGYSPTDRKL